MMKFCKRRQSKMERAYLRMYRQDSFIYQKRRCFYCKDSFGIEKVTADHVKPKKSGGTTTKENIRAACVRCNLAKGHSPKDKFNKSLKVLPEDAKIELRLCHIRYRLNRAIDKACENIISTWRTA